MLRIYFSSRDDNGCSLPTYIEVEADNPKNILYIHDKPIFLLGKPGTFDDSGIMPCWIIKYNKKKYLYYTGWNRSVSIQYRLAIGLAISDDKGKTYKKFSEGPICDRDIYESYWLAAPCVIKEVDIWKMWYISCTQWKIINGKKEPFYNIRYKESIDGINWKRKDQEIGITRSENGWDSEMIAYSYVHKYKDKTYLFYNGNGFGRKGLGYAVLEKKNYKSLEI